MAQKRMLNKTISVSAQVNKLSLKQKLIFTWTIPHLDDYGLITNDPEVIKALVVPMIQEITIQDVEDFISKGEEIGLTRKWSDCIEFCGFENHQSLSASKKAKCNFAKLPIIPQENIGENKNPQKSPVEEKRREVKESKDKRREGKGVQGETTIAAIAAPTPKEEATLFFNQMNLLIAGNSADCAWGQEFLTKLTEKYGSKKDVIWIEIKKFVDYWTEKNGAGTKERWQTEKTFEVKKRIITWFSKVGMYQENRSKKTLIT